MMVSRTLLLLFPLLFCYVNSLNQIIPASRHGSRVINGEDANLGQFPYNVALVTYSVTEIKLCSGAIISENWILTSGYCLHDSYLIEVYGGSVDQNDPDGLLFLTIDYYIHEEFDNITLQNDIGLLFIFDPLQFNENFGAIALPDEELGAGVEATISGWGHSNHDDNNNDTFLMQYASVSTIDNADCQSVYGDVITSGVVCTNVGDSGQSPCFGDAGGPLVVDADGDPVLVALFSFIGGESCTEYPAGYTRIQYYRDWIKEKTGI